MHNPFFIMQNLAQKNPRAQVENKLCTNRVSQRPKKKISHRILKFTNEKRPRTSIVGGLHRVNGRVAETRGARIA